uniref:Uncharacterized protein n=1 Tax=Romanomermis culicivorax TaxID=13658 RepID=A0A915JAS4_ROMCU
MKNDIRNVKESAGSHLRVCSIATGNQKTRFNLIRSFHSVVSVGAVWWCGAGNSAGASLLPSADKIRGFVGRRTIMVCVDNGKV